MAKQLDTLDWIPDLLPKDHLRKPMFGGFAFYVDSKIVLVIFENEGDRTHRGKKYNFDLWNGCLFPTERSFHPQITELFPELIPHPVLPKWLYLSVQSENFDSLVEELMKYIRARSALFGVMPTSKKLNKEKSKSTLSSEKIEVIDTRTPKMFSDEVQPVKIGKLKLITDLKNLGPSSAKEFQKAGIKSADQFIQMGWQKAFQKLVKSNPKNRHAIFAYALIGALKNIEWNRISEQDKLEARNLSQSLKAMKIKKDPSVKTKKKVKR